MGNDPVNKIDPTGENGVAAAAGIVVRVAWVACSAHPECREKAAQAAEKIAEKAVDIWIGEPPVVDRGSAKRRRSESVKDETWKRNQEQNNGENRCENCGDNVERQTGPSKKGEPRPDGRGVVDHKKPLADEGKDDSDNTQILCDPCHDDKTREENLNRR